MVQRLIDRLKGTSDDMLHPKNIVTVQSPTYGLKENINVIEHRKIKIRVHQKRE